MAQLPKVLEPSQTEAFLWRHEVEQLAQKNKDLARLTVGCTIYLGKRLRVIVRVMVDQFV